MLSSFHYFFTFQVERQRIVSDGSIELEVEHSDTVSLKNYKKTEAVRCFQIICYFISLFTRLLSFSKGPTI